jgi:hypothetical protein
MDEHGNDRFVAEPKPKARPHAKHTIFRPKPKARPHAKVRPHAKTTTIESEPEYATSVDEVDFSECCECNTCAARRRELAADGDTDSDDNDEPQTYTMEPHFDIGPSESRASNACNKFRVNIDHIPHPV